MATALIVLAVAQLVALVFALRQNGELQVQLGAMRQSSAVTALAASHRLDSQQSAMDGAVARISSLEAQLHALPDPANVAKGVLPSVFTIDTPTGQGSAFVVQSQPGNALLLTNYHVVAISQGSNQYYPSVDVVSGKLSFRGSVSGVDRSSDLATITVAQSFPALTRASALPSTGDTVYAFGAPLGLEGTETQGIVSNPSQQVQGSAHIQHTAAINPGNSGGPLIDRYGRVLGVNELSITNSQGLFFAVPIADLCVSLIRC
jgi:S1-C subfamily serine protease